MKAGIDGSRIVLVIPKLANTITCFNNPEVDTKMTSVLSSMGVTVLQNAKIVGFSASGSDAQSLGAVVCKVSNGSSLSVSTSESTTSTEIGVDTQSPTSPSSNSTYETIMTSMFLYADEKTIHPDAFQAINNACLVFDGKLVIDKYFRTVDPVIFAAGAFTKYAATYKTVWNHGCYSKREVGYKLAEYLLPEYDPLASVMTAHERSLELDPSNDPTPNKVLNFANAVVKEAYLPGGNYFLHFDKPRLPGLSLQERRKESNYGRDLIIDNATQGYFRLHLNSKGFITSLTYYGPQAPPTLPTNNYTRLYTVHEKYLNRLVSRFDEGLIKDFVAFFNEDSCLPVFHDRFGGFVESLRHDMLALKTNDGKEIVETIKRWVEKNNKDTSVNGLPSKEEQKTLFTKFDKSQDRTLLTRKVFAYLQHTEMYSSYP